MALCATAAYGRKGVRFLAARRSQEIRCADETGGSVWGVWIDGRNAGNGSDAYSAEYSEVMADSLGYVYKMLRENNYTAGLAYSHYLKIKDQLGVAHRHWKHASPVANEVRACHDNVLPADRVASVFANITTMSPDYKPGHVHHTDYPEILGKLFDRYNAIVAAALTRSQQLDALAFLMQNLAFAHPLVDMNGRMRLLLLQHELRRHGIACGTMMHNNNKNIYFETLSSYADKIREGIDVYDEAGSEGFSRNPWQREEAQKRHALRFPPDALTEALVECWGRKCYRPHSGCRGTSIV